MDLYEYQKKAMRTANMALTDNEQLTNAVIGLSGEAGELGNKVKKFLFQGHDFDKPAVFEEIGDCLWYIALACEAIGVNLEDVAQYNIDKLMQRYPGKFEPLASIHRVDKE
jgi:NTP pyrophosphatase (non-canonical NTP hydrolase)